jgi:ABC-type transport system involved in multi-copper enzyme maturation permease subunit
VELRKMVDTRSGIALLCAIELLAIGVAAVQLVAGKAAGSTLAGFFAMTQVPVSILLPVAGILSVTSEWSRRTTLITFALVPRRERVVAAKLLAAVVLTALAVVACLAVAAATNAAGHVAGRGNGSWHMTGAVLGDAFVALLASVLMGAGFGMLLRSSALAIVVYFVVPIVWSILGSYVSWLKSWAAWLDLSATAGPLLQGASVTAEGWAKFAVSAALWVLVPMLLGLGRLLCGEIK